MSTTFWCPQEDPKGVKEVYECAYCNGDMSVPDCTECGGTGEVVFYRRQHEVTVSLYNTSLILLSMGEPIDNCGEWPTDQLAGKLKVIDTLLSHPRIENPRQDYLFEVLPYLRALVMAAAAIKGTVTFG